MNQIKPAAMLSAFAVVEKIEQEAEKIQPFKQNKKTRMTVNL